MKSFDVQISSGMPSWIVRAAVPAFRRGLDRLKSARDAAKGKGRLTHAAGLLMVVIGVRRGGGGRR